MTGSRVSATLEAHLAERLTAQWRGSHRAGVVVWGASASGAWVCDALTARGVPFVLVDSDPGRQRSGLAGRPVQAPEAIAAAPTGLVVIASTSPEATATIRRRIAELHPRAGVLALVDLVSPGGLPADVVHLAVDRPRDGQRVQRRLAVQGWAAAGCGITHVEVTIEGRRRRLAYGVPRPDVAATLAATPGALHTGFVDVLDVSDLTPGAHAIEVTAWSADERHATVVRHIERAVAPPKAPSTCMCCGRGLAPSSRAVNDFDVMECVACGAASVVPPPDEAACREWYNDTDVYGMIARARRQAEESPVHPDATTLALLLRARLPAGRVRLLEVGCANGRLLNGLRQHGFDVTGLELSRETSRVARDLFGLDVRTGLLQEHSFDAPFDAIVARHVIEHVPDPPAEFERLRAKLRPGGVLLLVTPNGRSIAARLLRERWEWFIPPLHVHYFTAQAMTHLARRTGFEVVLARTRRGDARPLDEQLATWAAPLARKGARARAAAYRAALPVARLVAAAPDTLSRRMWHEELVVLLEAR